MSYDPSWPAQQRLNVVAAIVRQIQVDIPAGCYSEIGRPNCQSALHIAFDDAATLHDAMRDAPSFVRVAAGLTRLAGMSEH